MKIHPDVLAAHAEFGGDLECMQKCFEWHHFRSVVDAARSFMDLFVIDNGDDRGLSIEDIDTLELTHRFAALEETISVLEGRQ